MFDEICGRGPLGVVSRHPGVVRKLVESPTLGFAPPTNSRPRQRGDIKKLRCHMKSSQALKLWPDLMLQHVASGRSPEAAITGVFYLCGILWHGIECVEGRF